MFLNNINKAYEIIYSIGRNHHRYDEPIPNGLVISREVANYLQGKAAFMDSLSFSVKGNVLLVSCDNIYEDPDTGELVSMGVDWELSIPIVREVKNILDDLYENAD